MVRTFSRLWLAEPSQWREGVARWPQVLPPGATVSAVGGRAWRTCFCPLHQRASRGIKHGAVAEPWQRAAFTGCRCREFDHQRKKGPAAVRRPRQGHRLLLHGAAGQHDVHSRIHWWCREPHHDRLSRKVLPRRLPPPRPVRPARPMQPCPHAMAGWRAARRRFARPAKYSDFHPNRAPAMPATHP